MVELSKIDVKFKMTFLPHFYFAIAPTRPLHHKIIYVLKYIAMRNKAIPKIWKKFDVGHTDKSMSHEKSESLYLNIEHPWE